MRSLRRSAGGRLFLYGRGVFHFDGFADADLNPNPDLPVSLNEYAFSATDGVTRAVFTSRFDSAEDLQKVLDMGMEEGARTAINQIDGVLAESTQDA